MPCEIMVLSAHPDDAELAAGGVIKKITATGENVVLVDCTRGEMGTRGTAEKRAHEAEEAARILGVRTRAYLDMPDGAIEHTQENILRIVREIRAHRPRILLTTPPIERHPDHEAVHRLARAAAFTAGLQKTETLRDGVSQEPHRPTRIICFQQQYDLPRTPDFYVDITDTFEDKMSAIRAYVSQFHLGGTVKSTEPETFISRPEFIEELEARARYFGGRIGVRYAEAFYAVEPVGIKTLTDII